MSSQQMPFPILETPRLILRPPLPEDFEAWADMMQDETVARFLGGVQHRAVAWRAMATTMGAWLLRGYSMFSVIEKSSGQWIGRVGAHYPECWPGPEVGWGLIGIAQGRGLAKEAAIASLDYAFDVLGWTEAIHCIHPDNAPSIGLALSLGSPLMRHDHLPPPIDADCLVYGQSALDWRRNRKQFGPETRL